MRLAAVGKRDALVFDPSACSETELPVRLHQAQRHALIRGAALVIGPIADSVAAIVVHALREFPELVFLAVTSTQPPRLPTERFIHPIAI